MSRFHAFQSTFYPITIFFLIITVKQRIVWAEETGFEHKEGTDFQLTCGLNGTGQPSDIEIQWFLNDAQIHGNLSEENTTLTLHASRDLNGSKVKCEAYQLRRKDPEYAQETLNITCKLIFKHNIFYVFGTKARSVGL